MDYQKLIREEIEFQRGRLYKRLKTSEGGKLIVEYWEGSKNFLNSVHGISWEKQGNKILIKEKGTKMRSFRDIVLQELKSSRTGTTTQKDGTGHTHSAMLDDDGNGVTTGTKGHKDHVHKVKEYSVQPKNGHTHKLADGLNEKVRFDTTPWENSNAGKKPKGFGAWAFEVKGETVFSKAMKFGDAKKWIAKEHPDEFEIKVLP